MADRRYQFQSRPVQVYRWLRFKPLYFLLGLFACAKWLLLSRTLPRFPERSAYLLGADTPEIKYHYPHRTWREYLTFLITIHLSLADGRMQHTWTLQEVMDRVKQRIKAGELPKAEKGDWIREAAK